MSKATTKTEKIDLAQEVTDHVIELIESVSMKDYKNPFYSIASFWPKNASTGNAYSGLNILKLAIVAQKRGYMAALWGTFLQWQSLGATIKKGSRASKIMFAGIRPNSKKAIERGEPEERRVLSLANVFNVDQVEGYEVTLPDHVEGAHRDETLERFVSSLGVTVGEDHFAFYQPSTDKVCMPPFSYFQDTELDATGNYYATLLHELVHWTKAPSRLDRGHTDIEDPEHRKAAEELVAELGAAILCAHFGIDPSGRTDHARYLKSWLGALQGDKTYISRAAKQASAAVNYLLKLSEKAETQEETDQREAA